MKSIEEILDSLKNETLVFYGSYAKKSNQMAIYSGLVFKEVEILKVKEKQPELLPETEAYFSSRNNNGSEIKGSKFEKYFSSLEEYYIWFTNNDVDIVMAYDTLHDVFVNVMLDNISLLKHRTFEEIDELYDKFLKTTNQLHMPKQWGSNSVFEYIKDNYEIQTVQTLVKKGRAK